MFEESSTNRDFVPQQWESVNQRPGRPLLVTILGGTSLLPTSITRDGRGDTIEAGQKSPWSLTHSFIH